MKTEPLVAVFALAESGLWRPREFAAWALSLPQTNQPVWMLELQTGSSAVTVLTEMLHDEGVVLNNDYGNLVSGFMVLRQIRDDTPRATALFELSEIRDAYPSPGLTAEDFTSPVAPHVDRFLRALSAAAQQTEHRILDSAVLDGERLVWELRSP